MQNYYKTKKLLVIDDRAVAIKQCLRSDEMKLLINTVSQEKTFH